MTLSNDELNHRLHKTVIRICQSAILILHMSSMRVPVSCSLNPLKTFQLGMYPNTVMFEVTWRFCPVYFWGLNQNHCIPFSCISLTITTRALQHLVTESDNSSLSYQQPYQHVFCFVSYTATVKLKTHQNQKVMPLWDIDTFFCIFQIIRLRNIFLLLLFLLLWLCSYLMCARWRLMTTAWGNDVDFWTIVLFQCLPFKFQNVIYTLRDDCLD